MSKLKTGIVSISLLAVSLAIAPEVKAAETAESLMDKAFKIMTSARPNPKAAEELLHEAVRISPDNAKAHLQLGTTIAAQAAALPREKEKEANELYATAIQQEETALKLDPKLYRAHVMLGHIYSNQGKHDKAIAALKEAVALKPDSYGAQRDLGIACLTGGKVDEGIEAFRKATLVKPELPEAHMKLAILLSKRGSIKEAVDEATEASRLAPKDPETHIALGNILLESNDYDGSIKPFKIALSFAKNHPNALSGMGLALASKGSPEAIASGIDYQKKALASSGGYFMPAHIRMAELLQRQGKTKEAEAQYQTALKVNPNDPLTGTAYGKFLEQVGRKDDARNTLKKVLEKSPHFKPASEALSTLDKPSTTK